MGCVGSGTDVDMDGWEMILLTAMAPWPDQRSQHGFFFFFFGASTLMDLSKTDAARGLMDRGACSRVFILHFLVERLRLALVGRRVTVQNRFLAARQPLIRFPITDTSPSPILMAFHRSLK